MKRFILLVSLVGAAISGFLWWKRREVERAESVARDPWPSVVAETKVSQPQAVTPAPIDQMESKTQSEVKKPTKKATKKATKKVEADPTS